MINSSAITLDIFLYTVPFREAPTYSNRRRRPPSTLAAPRILLRSNSDNNLNINNIPEWSASSSASSHRSLSPHLLQQMQNNPNGTVKTVGSYTPSSRSRSPSLNRLGEDGKRQQHRHIRWILNIDKVWDIPNAIMLHCYVLIWNLSDHFVDYILYR